MVALFFIFSTGIKREVFLLKTSQNTQALCHKTREFDKFSHTTTESFVFTWQPWQPCRSLAVLTRETLSQSQSQSFQSHVKP